MPGRVRRGACCCVRPSERKKYGVRPYFYIARARPAPARGRLFLCTLHARHNPSFQVGGLHVVIIPHDAVLQGHSGQGAVVAYGHVGAHGAVLQGHVLADNAGLNNGGSGVVDLAGFYAVLQQPGVGLQQGFGEAAVQPFLYGGGAELAALLDHHLQGVGELELATGANVVVHQVLQGFLEGLNILDVVNAHDGLVAHEFLGLFYQAADAALVVGHGHAKAAGVLDLVGVQHVLGGASEALDVGVEQGVAQYDEHGLVVTYVGEC